METPRSTNTHSKFTNWIYKYCSNWSVADIDIICIDATLQGNIFHELYIVV